MEILKDLIIAYLPVGGVVDNGRVSVSFSYRLRIRCGCRFDWGTAAIRGSFSFYPNIRTVSAAGRRMLEPSLIFLCISPQINMYISVLHDKGMGHLEDVCL